MALDRGSRRWLALFPPIAVGLLITGGGLTPKGLDRPATSMHTALTQLPIAAAHADRLCVANMLIIFGLGALGVSFVGIATLAEGRRGAVVACWGAAIGGFACFCGAVVNVLVGIVLAGAGQSQTTTAAAARVLVSIDTAFVSYALLVAYLVGLLIASVLVGVALWRSQCVPRWLAVAFPITMIIGGAASPGLINVLLSLPLAVVMVMLARAIWRTGGSRGVATVADTAATSSQLP
jgi:hypothetical protein